MQGPASGTQVPHEFAGTLSQADACARILAGSTGYIFVAELECHSSSQPCSLSVLLHEFSRLADFFPFT